jgi:hypothetical protein
MKAHKRSKFAVSMKKSFYISLIFLLILFLTTITGLSNNKKNMQNSSLDQIGLKASDVQQHDILFIASIAENDVDLDKTFFDLPFVLFAKDILFRGLESGSHLMMSSVSESTHHYHLPRYLLFHNLKIRI